MKGLKYFVAGIAALALLAMPAGALAKSRDHNHDRIPDRWEKRFHLSTRVNVAHKDPDHDGLNNLAEFRNGTNPRKADTDNDGLDDGAEVQVGDNPTNPDTDNDGVEDGQEVSGTVASFDGTTLVIQLPGEGAGTVRGTVNSSTEVECNNDNENENSTPTATTSEDGGSSDTSGSGDNTTSSGDNTTSGDNSGPGSTMSGDDNQAGDDDQNGENDNDEDDQAQQPCTIAVGDVVHEAKLIQSDGGNTFTKVELDK